MKTPTLPAEAQAYTDCPGCHKVFWHDGTQDSILAFNLAAKLHAAECVPLNKMGWNDEALPIFPEVER